MSGWGVTNLRDPQLESRDDTVEVRVEPGDVIDSSDAIFWIAPQIYRGNKVGVSVVILIGATTMGVVGVRTPSEVSMWVSNAPAFQQLHSSPLHRP